MLTQMLWAATVVGSLTESHCLDVKTRTHQPTWEEEEEEEEEEGGLRSKCDCLATYGSRRAKQRRSLAKNRPRITAR